jgi:hypothetical protein
MRYLKLTTMNVIKCSFNRRGIHNFIAYCWSLLLLFSATPSYGQQALVSLSILDGMDLTPDNVFRYQVQSTFTTATPVHIIGDLRYSNTDLYWHYEFDYTLQPGINTLDAQFIHAQWSYSSSAFKELFVDYKTLPEGVYEYCVSVQPLAPTGEPLPLNDNKECLLGVSKDLFLINLVAPENDAKLYEYNPMLNWVVTYPFASLLTYRIRVAKILDGQNIENAIARNNPIYQEANVPQTAQIYPFYATPLVAFQPYAWTVDAYYKGILLGGAAPWKFTIIEDSARVVLPHESYYVDISMEQNATRYYAVGVIKLKYVLEEKENEELLISLMDNSGKPLKLPESSLLAKLGDNRFVLQLKDKVALQHLQVYTLVVTNSLGIQFSLPFKYVNPDLL